MRLNSLAFNVPENLKWINSTQQPFSGELRKKRNAFIFWMFCSPERARSRCALTSAPALSASVRPAWTWSPALHYILFFSSPFNLSLMRVFQLPPKNLRHSHGARGCIDTVFVSRACGALDSAKVASEYTVCIMCDRCTESRLWSPVL